MAGIFCRGFIKKLKYINIKKKKKKKNPQGHALRVDLQ